MNKNVKIISIILFVTILSIFIVMPISMAATSEETVIGTLFNTEATGNAQITSVGGKIVSIITTIGIIVAVIVLLILGIKYMMGSASEKAEYKKTMIPYLVGAVLIFGASAIAKAIIAMSKGIVG